MLFFWWQSLYQRKANEDENNNTIKNMVEICQIVATIVCCTYTLFENQRKRMAVLKNIFPSRVAVSTHTFTNVLIIYSEATFMSVMSPK
jgi:TnpA family transposase